MTDVAEPPSSPQPQYSLVPLRRIWPQEIAFFFPTRDHAVPPTRRKFLHRQQMQVSRLWYDMILSFSNQEVPDNFAGYKSTSSDLHIQRACDFADERDTWQGESSKRPKGFRGTYEEYIEELQDRGFPQVGNVEYYFPSHSCYYAADLQLLLAQMWDPAGDWVIYGGWAFAHSTIVCRRTLRVFDALLEPLDMSAEEIIEFANRPSNHTLRHLRPRSLIHRKSN